MDSVVPLGTSQAPQLFSLYVIQVSLAYHTVVMEPAAEILPLADDEATVSANPRHSNSISRYSSGAPNYGLQTALPLAA